jgi:hypothetical protein
MTMGPRFSWLSLGLVACGVASGCAASTPPDASLDVDAGLPSNVTPAPDGMGFCCAPERPTCDCRSLGGHAETVSECAALPRWCDVHPDSWMPVTDAHGCSFYVRQRPPDGRSCFPDVDGVGLDAGPG